MSGEFVARKGIISQGNIVISGSITTTGGITVSGSIASASYSLSSSYASSGTSASYAVSSSYALSSSYSLSSSYAANSTSASYALSSSYALNSTLHNGTASAVFATTGSNNLVGDQHITSVADASAFAATASLYTDGGLQVAKNAYFSSSMFIKGNLTIYGTQSVAYITSSQLNIATNLITVNTATPSVRFGGLAVYDSGSTGTGMTGSLLWDSQNNSWIYDNPSGSGNYDSSMVIMGPRNSGSLGTEVGLNCNYLIQGHGHHHTTSSGIFHDGSTTCLPGTVITSCNLGIGVSPVLKLDVQGNAADTATVGGVTVEQVTLFRPSNGVGGIRTGYNTTTGDAYLWSAQSGGNLNLGTRNAPNTNVNLTISYTGVSCFSGAVCAPMFLASGCIGIGITSPSATLDINSTGGVGGWTGIKLKTGTSSVQSLSMGQVTAGNGAWIGTAQYNLSGYWQTEGTAASVINFASDGTFQISTNCGLTANTNYNLCQRLTIASNGYTGINTPSPIDYLTVCGAIVTTKNTVLTNCNAAIFDYNSPGGRMLAYTTGGSILQFYTNYTGCGMAERVRIDACGNVGIGCNSPAYKLDILGSGGLRITDTEANIVLNSCGGGSGIWRLIGSTGATTKLFRIFDADNAIDRFNITAGGYIGMGHTTPPYNLTICCTGQVIINVRTSTTTSGSESGLLISTPDSIGLMSVGAADARGVNTAIRCDMVIGLRTGGRILFTTDPNANYHNLALTCGNSSGGGHLIPYTTGIQNLGCATNRFGTVYTSDLSLSNGIGDYTIVEGESDLFIYNNKQCKVYKFMLQEVCTECAIPKKS